MTVQFVGLDDNEGVIASDTRVIKKDGTLYDDFVNPKVYHFGPRLLAVFSGMSGTINNLASELIWAGDLTPQKIVERLIAFCSQLHGQDRLGAVILGDENGEMVAYAVNGHLDGENETPYKVFKYTKENRPIYLTAGKEAAEKIYTEYRTGIPLRNLAIRTVQILGEHYPEACSKFPEVWVLPKEGPAFCYKSTHIKTMPIINGLNQVRANSGEGVNPIFGNGFQLDKTGIYGHSEGIRRVEIRTDGRLACGDLKVVGDEKGLKMYDRPYTDPASEVQVAIGDISGYLWKGGPLPAGTYGLWAPEGLIAVSENDYVIVADSVGIHTTSTEWQDIPGFVVNISLKESAAIFITARFNARVRTTTDVNVVGYFRLLRNETQLDLATIGINTGGTNIVLRTPVMCSYLDKRNAGIYQYKCQFCSINSGVEVSSFDRELIVNVMKR